MKKKAKEGKRNEEGKGGGTEEKGAAKQQNEKQGLDKAERATRKVQKKCEHLKPQCQFSK